MVMYRKIVVLLCVFLPLAACLTLRQSKEKIEFYTLEYDPPKMVTDEPIPVVMKMERFSVAPPYNTTRIIYRDRSFRRDAYVYYRWRANPGDLVSHFLGRDIRQSGLCTAVIPGDSRSASSHRLEGSVEEFFEWDTQDNWKAVLSLSITLMAENEPDISKRVLFQKAYRATKACAERNPGALAEAMSRAVAEVSGQIIKDIYDALRLRSP